MRRMRGGKKTTAICVVLCSKGVAYIVAFKSLSLRDVCVFFSLNFIFNLAAK